MLNYKVVVDEHGQQKLLTGVRGKALLTIPQLNKGTAFTERERMEFNLMGKLPSTVETLEEQAERAYLQFSKYEENINKNIYLNYLLNTNQVLFYKLVRDHVEEMLPAIYTPVVGNAVQEFNQRFFQPRGLYIAYPERHRIDTILNNRSNRHARLVVVSDGEGVLGIGDQGVGAMAIPVAKLMVYSAIGGINPNTTIPIFLDAGTNNQNLLNDPMYLGWRHPRIVGDQYEEFIANFIEAAKRNFPHLFLHWEDFGSVNAFHNLMAYRDEVCSFNDDIQGTGVVTVAALLSAARQTKTPLTEHRIVVFGAGAAGMGVTSNIVDALCRQGLDLNTARHQFWLIDRPGLLTQYIDNANELQQPFLRSKTEIDQWQVTNRHAITLQEVIDHVKPTILIGASAVTGAFTEDIIRSMAQHVKQPIIFPLSNPNERSEAQPQQLIDWTENRALIATGSPFGDATWRGKTIAISQCNNYLAFPGIGLGVIASSARNVSDNMLWAASKALSQATEPGRLLPTVKQAVATTSRIVAIATAQAAIDEGLADHIDNVAKQVDSHRWAPQYLPYERI